MPAAAGIVLCQWAVLLGNRQILGPVTTFNAGVAGGCGGAACWAWLLGFAAGDDMNLEHRQDRSSTRSLADI